MEGELMMIANSGGHYYIRHALPMVKNDTSLNYGIIWRIVKFYKIYIGVRKSCIIVKILF